MHLYTGGTGLSDPNLGTAPCRPTQPKPYLGLIGAADAVLQTIGNWSQQYWAVNPARSATPGFVDANLVNEEFFHRRIRVPLYCSGTVANPTLSADAKRTSWSDCGVAGPTRPHRDRRSLPGTDAHLLGEPAGAQRLPLRDLLVGFFTATEEL